MEHKKTSVEFENRNDKQLFFNRIKGELKELNYNEDKYCNITISVGHENKRDVNFVMDKQNFEKISETHKIGDKICVQFFVVSRKNKANLWYTILKPVEVTSC